jgi:sulfhydrogenase subunit delta
MNETAKISVPKASKRKMAIGWFTFTCCEDSTILFTELLNDYYDQWRELVEFRHVKSLKTNNTLEGLDVAFIEGAISSESQAQEVRKIRENSKYVVAIGACAVTGMPSGSRNDFKDAQINERINWYLSHFDYNKRVLKLDEVIKVDDKVEGCPMSVDMFLGVLMKYLKVFELA